MSLAEIFSEHPDLSGRRPPWREGIRAAAGALRSKKARTNTGPARRVEERRKYVGDPWKYFAEVLGWALTPQQEEALEWMEREARLLIAAANNVGKTWLLGGYAVYTMDVPAAVSDALRNLEERGAMIVLPGPDHDTIEGTIYREILMHLRRALSRGYGMPGEWSEKSVLWRARPDWFVEAFAPPKHVGQDVAHTVSGRHHENLTALIEEGQGVAEPIWRATEGMCSGAGNKIISPFNPTEPTGPAFTRARAGTYKVLHLDAFGHPNVRERRPVIPAAISHATIDARVRTECVDRGPAAVVHPDPHHQDFVYALPPAEALEVGARTDSIPGHPEGEPHVYRPSGLFQAQVLGRWPQQLDTGLFEPSAWDKGVERWKARMMPDGPPTRVGVDVAREGDDETCAATAWGEGSETLLNAYAEAELEGAAAVARLRAERGVYCGMPEILRKGDGVEIAQQLTKRWQAPMALDITGGIGASALDHLRRVMKRPAAGISFSASPPGPTPGEPYSENLRASLYVRAARMVALGLVDPPDDPLLREEVMATKVEYKGRTVKDERGHPVRVLSVQIIDKKRIVAALGRSPDRADAFVLSLYEPPIEEDVEWEVW